jgi:hypothetical protein
LPPPAPPRRHGRDRRGARGRNRARRARPRGQGGRSQGGDRQRRGAQRHRAQPLRRGGRCQEYALALALDGAAGISALAADTDGIDGGESKPTDAPGAFVDCATLEGVRHCAAKNFLHNNDATSFFEAAGG